jgi:dienelactone hydrolase
MVVAALSAAAVMCAGDWPPPPELATIADERRSRGLADWPAGLDAAVASSLQEEAERLRTGLVARRAKLAAGKIDPSETDSLSVPEAHLRHVVWTLRYETELAEGDVERLRRALREGHRRLWEVTEDRPSPWHRETGHSVRAYRSEIDGSAQAFGLIVPEDIVPTQPVALDVVLHGSIRPRGGAALRFADRFLTGRPGPQDAGRPGVVELHPLGRVENGYRWAGETDVFEAIEAVCRHLPVDRRRIVLRGFSMGASGTWHVGLKHPGFFAGLAPYCGYVDTYRFSASPNPRFVRVRDLRPHQAATLAIHDAVGYAANAGLVPVVAAMGEHDPGFVNHRYMAEAFAAERLTLTNLIAPGTAHAVAPATLRDQRQLLDDRIAARPRGPPDRVRFVTWTLRYPGAHWVELRRLGRHYERAEIVAERTGEGILDVPVLRNIDAVEFRLEDAPAPVRLVRLPDREIPVRPPDGARSVRVERAGGGWRAVFEPAPVLESGKRPGLQGPIDDAFTRPFLCVVGTDEPWHPAVQAWAEAELRRFARLWERYFGGVLPVKRDTEVTEDDLRDRHLVLFGDPGSNRWIRAVLPGLPMAWTRDCLRLGADFSADRHVPRLIAPNPLPHGRGRYVVLNSGHTFGEEELSTLNYLLFPRLGDWAVMEIQEVAAQEDSPASAWPPARIAAAGLFDEGWRLPTGPSNP